MPGAASSWSTAPARRRRTSSTWPARCAPRAWRRSASTSAGTARARAPWAPTRSTTSPTMARCCRPARVALRGSSMGGFMALMASTRMELAAVVAVCPASGELLARGLRDGRFSFRADHDGLHASSPRPTSRRRRAALGERLLLMHAEGDESGADQRLARRCTRRARQPPDRGARRPSPLDPARPRADRRGRALPHAGIAAAPSGGLSTGVRTSDDVPASSAAAPRSSGRLPQRAARANSMMRP